MNARVTERLEALADALELGDLTLRNFAEQIPGHLTAIERLPYSHIKEAQMAVVQIGRMADAQERGEPADITAAANWLRRWVSMVPK